MFEYGVTILQNMASSCKIHGFNRVTGFQGKREREQKTETVTCINYNYSTYSSPVKLIELYNISH